MPFFSYGGFLQVRPTHFHNSVSGSNIVKEQRLRKKPPPPFLPPHPPPIPQPARRLRRIYSVKHTTSFFLSISYLENNDVVVFSYKRPAADFVCAALKPKAHSGALRRTLLAPVY